MKDVVHVSPEMITLVGEGAFPKVTMPHGSVIFIFQGLSDRSAPTLIYRDDCDLDDVGNAPLVLVVKQEACARIFGAEAMPSQSWFLPSALRDLALSIIDCGSGGEVRTTLRLARSIELLCQVHQALANGTLVPSGGDAVLTEQDVAKIAAARREIDERWQEKLTIADIARNAGLNRDKLVRGFRDLYGKTIAEVLNERRLKEARKLLLASDLSVASVAYRCSYLNNASFTRAFSRHYGIAPTEFRRMGVMT